MSPPSLTLPFLFLLFSAACDAPILPDPELSVIPESVAFHTVSGQAVPPETLTIESSGVGGLEWIAAASAHWLRLEPQSGTTPSETVVSLQSEIVANLGAGEYGDTLRVSTQSGKVEKIPVHLTISEPTRWMRVDRGDWHTCGIDDRRELYCWGLARYGQLGTGDREDRSIPAPVVGGYRWAQVSAGETHTCGLTVDGDLYCWGDNDRGQLGIGAASDQLTPRRVEGGSTWARVSAAGEYTCGFTAEGNGYCWGNGELGQLGTGDTNDRSVPAPIQGGYRWLDLDGEEYHHCGVTSEREVYCWGVGSSGQLGIGEQARSSEPTQPVLGEHAWVEVSAGRAHSCGVTAAGNLLCWGAGTAGQLGRGIKLGQFDPRTVRGDFAWSRVTAHGDYACGLTMGNTAYCWGHNRFGDLGIGSAQDVGGEPTPVAGDHKWSALSAGGFGACGVTLDGKAYCWGSGSYGRIGDGSMEQRRVPVRVSEPE